MNAPTPQPPRYSLILSLVCFVATFGCVFGMCGLSRKPEEQRQELILCAVLGILAWVWGGAIGVWFGRIFPRRGGLEDRMADIAYRLALVRRSRFWLWVFAILAVVTVVASLVVGFVLGRWLGLVDGARVAFFVLLPLAGAAAVVWFNRPAGAPDLDRFVMARRLRFDYLRSPPQDGFGWVRSLRLWGTAPEKYQVGDTLTGERAGNRVLVLAYVWVSAPLDATQTLYVLEGLPALPFVLFPHARQKEVARFLSTAYLPLDGTPLADTFAAQGDARALRLLTPEVCALCLARPDCCLELSAGRLVLTVPDRVDRAKDYPATIDHLLRLGVALSAACPEELASVPGPFLPVQEMPSELVRVGEQPARPARSRQRVEPVSTKRPVPPAWPAQPRPVVPDPLPGPMAAAFLILGLVISIPVAIVLFPSRPGGVADDRVIGLPVCVAIVATTVGAFLGWVIDLFRAAHQSPSLPRRQVVDDEEDVDLRDEPDRERFAWLRDRLGGEPTRVLVGEVDDYPVAVLESGSADTGRTLYLIDEAGTGLPGGPLTRETLRTFGWRVGQLAASRPDLSLEVVGVILIASASGVAADAIPTNVRHLLTLADELQEAIRRQPRHSS
jgi:hypothetical protein